MANYERHDVRETIFSVMRNTETGKCKITCGNNLMTETEFASLKDAIKYVKSKPWELITNLCALMVNNLYLTINKQNEQNND